MGGERGPTPAWVAAKADLFRAPANDRGAPETTITAAPARPLRPQDAVVRVSGDDAEVPAELLKFRVTADGEAREPTYVKAFKVGEVGKTATVHVAVAAIDLAGNEDGSPAEADITVDGILPRLTLLDYPFGTIDTTAPQVRWTADDDLSPADRIGATIEIWHMLDGQGASLDGTQLVDTLEVDPGDTEVKLGLDPGRGYRVIVTVHDEAGNKAADAFLFAVSADAAGPGGCGCRVAGRDGGAGGGAAAVGLFALGLALARARRRKA